MSSITPFKSYTASLFGGEMKKGAGATTSLPSNLSSASRVPVAVPQVRSEPAEYEPQWVKDGRASLAKAEAEFAAWEAKEQQFEQENGYRRKVNEGALGAYAKAQSGHFAVPAFKDAGEAGEYLEYIVSSMRSNASTIASSAFEAQSLAKPEVAAYYGEVKTSQLQAKYADSKLAAEMDMFVLNAVLTKAFNMSGAIYRQDGGAMSFVAQDFTFEGKAIARLSEDGTLIRLGADGQAVGVDKRV